MECNATITSTKRMKVDWNYC